MLNVSVGRTVDALTGRDWEGTGVAPDREVPSGQALAVAQLAAMEDILPGLAEADRPRGERLVAFYRAQAVPQTPSRPFTAYAGKYGQFTVLAGDHGLTMHFATFAPEPLIVLEGNRFAAVADPATQIRFVIEGDTAVALELDSGNGPPARIARED